MGTGDISLIFPFQNNISKFSWPLKQNEVELGISEEVESVRAFLRWWPCNSSRLLFTQSRTLLLHHHHLDQNRDTSFSSSLLLASVLIGAKAVSPKTTAILLPQVNWSDKDLCCLILDSLCQKLSSSDNRSIRFTEGSSSSSVRTQLDLLEQLTSTSDGTRLLLILEGLSY